MLSSVFFLMAVVVILGAILARSRVRRRLDSHDPMTDDPVLREILAESDTWPEEEEADPLDEEEIREAEDRFWEQEWDRPEDWRG